MDTKKVAKKLRPLIEKYLVVILEEEKPVIIDIIMKDYDLMLNGVDTNRDSQSRPEFYEDKFRDLLENLTEDFWINIIEGSDTQIEFKVPSTTNLDLKELPVLKLIFEGVVGKYVTATSKQFKQAGLKIGSRIPLDEKVRRDDRVYLIRFTDPMKRRMESSLNLKRGLPLYVFSNTPGIDIFENADMYYEENIDKWIEEATDMATDELERIYK